jgi:hypothetical protein
VTVPELPVVENFPGRELFAGGAVCAHAAGAAVTARTVRAVVPRARLLNRANAAEISRLPRISNPLLVGDRPVPQRSRIGCKIPMTRMIKQSDGEIVAAASQFAEWLSSG